MNKIRPVVIKAGQLWTEVKAVRRFLRLASGRELIVMLRLIQIQRMRFTEYCTARFGLIWVEDILGL